MGLSPSACRLQVFAADLHVPTTTLHRALTREVAP